MLLNYLKITLKVLGRNPFFTFVSLFGIVFTVSVLLLLTAFLDHLIAPHYPDVNRGRSLYVGHLDLYNEGEPGHRLGPPSYRFLDTYVSKMETPEMIGITSLPAYANAYSGNRRLKLNLKFSNPAFWDIMRFEFLEGKAFNASHIENGDYVAVINESTRANYFGADVEAVGKNIVVENVSYRVLGVVRDVPITRPMVAGDVYLPFNVRKSQAQSASLTGNYVGILMAADEEDLPRIREEYESMIAKIPLPQTNEGFTFDTLKSSAVTYLEYFLRIGFDVNHVSTWFYTLVAIFMVLFMLLPAINLVNLNVSRIMERSSEIGIRKAFGASVNKLVGQFLIENIFITFLGGLVATAFAWLIIAIFNESGLIPGADLALNFRVLLIALGICLLFGLISGVVPAYRMSRLHVIDALRGGEA